MDCLANRRFARVEIKPPGEPVPAGQGAHLRALHGMASNFWEVLLLLVWDEGQSEGGHQVRFAWCSSRGDWVPPKDWTEHRTTLDALGRGVASWLWCGAERPGFLQPPPPRCAVCGEVLPARPQQTIPVDDRMRWVCLDCFHIHLGAVKAARAERQAEAVVGDGSSKDGYQMDKLV